MFALIEIRSGWIIKASRMKIGVIDLKMVVSTTGSGKRVRSQGHEREKEIANPNLLRITGGTVSGMKIDSPNVYLRPMMAKVGHVLYKEYFISFVTHLGARGALQLSQSLSSFSYKFYQSFRFLFWFRICRIGGTQ